MTLVSDIIRDAYRETNITAIGVAPNALQSDEALRLLNRNFFIRKAVINDLLTTDQFPFPREYDDYFVVGLAMRINPRNGASLDPQSVQAYKEAKMRFDQYQGRRVFVNAELPLLFVGDTSQISFADFATGQTDLTSFYTVYDNLYDTWE